MARDDYRQTIKNLNKKYTGKRVISDEGKRETASDRARHAKADEADRKANKAPSWLKAKEGTKERKEQDRKYESFKKDLRHGKYGKAGRFSHETIKDKDERDRSKARYDKQVNRTGDERLNITKELERKYKQADPTERQNIIDDISSGVGTYQTGGKYSYPTQVFQQIKALEASGASYDKRRRGGQPDGTVVRSLGIPQRQLPTQPTQAQASSKPSHAMTNADYQKVLDFANSPEGKEFGVDQNLIDEANQALSGQGQGTQPQQPAEPSQEEQRQALIAQRRAELNAMYDAQRQAQQAKLSGAKSEQVQALQERARQLTEQADLSKIQADVRGAKTERGLEEQLATSGLQRGGTAEQRRLELATSTGQQIGDITRQEMTGQRQLSQEQQNVERRYQDSLQALDAQTAQLKQQAMASVDQMQMAQSQLDETKRQFDESMKFNGVKLAEQARQFDTGLANDMKRFYDNLSVQQSQFDAQINQKAQQFNASLSQQQQALDKDYQFKYDQLNANLAISDAQRQDGLNKLQKDYELNKQRLDQDLLKFNANQQQSMQQFISSNALKYDQMAQQASQYSQSLAQQIAQQKQQYQLGWGRINSNEKIQQEKMAQQERLAQQKQDEQGSASMEKALKPYQSKINNIRSEATKYNTSVYGGANQQDANKEVSNYIDKLFQGGNIDENQWKYLYDVNNL